MTSRHEELRDELVAILGAGRELSPDVDHQLAEAFLRALEKGDEPLTRGTSPVEQLHQPHYSLRIAGGAWGAALMFLLAAIIWGHPTADQFIGVAIILLLLVAIATRSFLYLARHDWQLPHVRLVSPPGKNVEESRRSRGI
ncbi:MAG TPA: hypothetical protein VFB58_05635 [Chloroflexota bacterium]|nr:hypothetical protein [Chloroflexota bacterium]